MIGYDFAAARLHPGIAHGVVHALIVVASFELPRTEQ
jgi:hypothetical protein